MRAELLSHILLTENCKGVLLGGALVAHGQYVDLFPNCPRMNREASVPGIVDGIF